MIILASKDRALCLFSSSVCNVDSLVNTVYLEVQKLMMSLTYRSISFGHCERLPWQRLSCSWDVLRSPSMEFSQGNAILASNRKVNICADNLSAACVAWL